MDKLNTKRTRTQAKLTARLKKRSQAVLITPRPLRPHEEALAAAIADFAKRIGARIEVAVPA